MRLSSARSASGRKMRRKQQRLLGLGISMLGVLTLSPALLGQAPPEHEAAAPVLRDWSHHHVIFSRPATAEQAQPIQQVARYSQQLHRQAAATAGRPASGGAPTPQ